MFSGKTLIQLLFPSREKQFEIDIIGVIKKIGSHPTDYEHLDIDTDIILGYMSEYTNALPLQRVCCHALSNLCMDIESSKFIVLQKSAHKQVIETINSHIDIDWRLCWLGCSALWNMTRDRDCRNEFALDTVDLLITVLKKNYVHKPVVNTVIGTLSNLCLDNDFKQYIGKESNVLELLNVIEKWTVNEEISTTSCGLFANLAVNDNLADILVDFGTLNVMQKMFQHDFNEMTFNRNVSAALSNFITSPKFVKECVRLKIVEWVVNLRPASVAVIALTINCMEAFGVDPRSTTTSYHVAARNGLTKVFLELIENDQGIFDLNMPDGSQKTLLTYSIEFNHMELVDILTKCGATIYTSDVIKDLDHEKNVKSVIDCAKQEIKTVQKCHINIIKNCTVIVDSSSIIVDMLPPHEIMKFCDGLNYSG
jgi:hypothetical protein